MQDYVKQDKNIKYLEDEALTIEFNDAKINLWGTPWTGIHGKPGKGFQVPRDTLVEKWDKIPVTTDILISHMPPYDILDRNGDNKGGIKAGCKDLQRTVLERVKPRIHVFGHIHESHGTLVKDGILFINAASKIPKTEDKMNAPVVVNYDLESREVMLES